MKFLNYLKAFLGFAAKAAPVAAEMASMTGHQNVVDDINKAGHAADLANSLANAETKHD